MYQTLFVVFDVHLELIVFTRLDSNLTFERMSHETVLQCTGQKVVLCPGDFYGGLAIVIPFKST